MTHSSLWKLKIHQSAKLSHVGDGACDCQKRRLAELGFQEGKEIICTRSLPFDGPRVYQISDTVISLDKELAKQVQIQND